MQRVRTRYAPSPTGHLHIGNARTALFSYLFARRNGGDFILRIEDTDIERNVVGGEYNQMEGLKWLGVEWDESVDKGGPYGPYRCLERLDLYQRYVKKLLAEGKAYKSYSTPEEIEQERQEQLAKGVAPKYSGWDRDLTPDEQAKYEAAGRVPSIRLRVPEGELIRFVDAVRGEVKFDSDGIGDFVIMRPDGRPTYNFACVIDDVAMKITHVIRGEEHISNTPRQLLVYQALGYSAPQFAHIPLILNPAGKKMSKRDESIVQFIEQYKQLGYLPEALVNFMTLLGWAPEGEEEIFSLEDLCQIFSLERISKAPAIFDTNKLKWMNNYYIKKSPLERIVNLALPYFEKAGRLTLPLDEGKREWITQVISLYQEQLDEIGQIVELSDLFFREEIEYTKEGQQILEAEQVSTILSAFLSELDQVEEFTPDVIKTVFKSVQKKTGCKGKALFMPIRIAATGEVHGPDLRRTLSLIGIDQVKRRLQKVMEQKVDSESPSV